MVTSLFEIIRTEFASSPFDGTTHSNSKVVAVCSTKKKAIAKLKEVAIDPPCEAVTKAEYDEALAATYIENRYGYKAEYRIEEILLDEWID